MRAMARVNIEPADAEIRPSLAGSGDFAPFKGAERAGRCRFVGRGYRQSGAGRHEGEVLTLCIVDLPRTQADHTARERGNIF